MRLNLNQRLTAAIFYLLLAIFQFGILIILFDVGGTIGVSYLLSAENPVRNTVAYLIAAGTISLGILGILLHYQCASKRVKRSLLALGVAQLIGGVVYAQVTVITTLVALGFLVVYSRAPDA